jgi:hypothetical protein
MFEFKPDFEAVQKRFDAWWQCAIVDRPLVSIGFPRPEAARVPWPGKTHASLRDRWMDTEYAVACAEANLRNTVHFADQLPIAFPNLGPEVFSAFYGCEMEYGEHTAWSKPILHDWSKASLDAIRLDTDGFFFRKVMEVTQAMLEQARGRYIVGYTDLHGGGDAIAALREPQELLIDVLEHPAEIKELCDRVTTGFLHVYDRFHAELSAAGMPSTTWCPVIGPGKVHIPSCDFSCMISDEAFEDLFIPGIVRECRHMDRCLYHLDGPQALRYLDRLLDIPEIHAIQWVPGAGHDRWSDWIGVYQRIQSRGKALQILHVPAGDLPRLFEALAPEGVWISALSGISTIDEAEAALAAISRWTKKR